MKKMKSQQTDTTETTAHDAATPNAPHNASSAHDASRNTPNQSPDTRAPYDASGFHDSSRPHDASSERAAPNDASAVPHDTVARAASERATDLASFFGALCFFLSAIEFLIPKPLPFLRLGLANVPLIIAMRVLSFKYYALLVALKLIGQALIGGTLFSYIFLFSACGTISSALMMFLLYTLFGKHIGCTGISIAGALSSNAAQLLLARYFIFGEGALLIAPPFLLVGTVTSLLLGLFSEFFIAHSTWFRLVQSGAPLTLTTQAKTAGKKSAVKAGIGFALLVALLFSITVAMSAAIFALSVILLIVSHKKLHLVTCLIASAAIIALNLITPAGRVLFEWRAFKITADALTSGVNKALVLEGMIYLSRFTMSNVTVVPLGFLGKVLARSLAVFARLTENAPNALAGRAHSPAELVAALDEKLMAFCAISDEE